MSLGILPLGRRPRHPRVLIVGHTGGGKTSLFASLLLDIRAGAGAGAGAGAEASAAPRAAAFAARDATVTSSEPGRCVLPCGGGASVELVDVPGDPRLRTSLLGDAPELWRGVRGIVFVVDSVNFMKDARVTTELMYELLTHRQVARHAGRSTLRMLVCCNKSDKVTAYSADFIKKRLEKELNSIRKSRSTLRDTDDAGGPDAAAAAGGGDGLGGADEAFTFDRKRPIDVGMASISVLKNSLEPARAFILARDGACA